MIPPKANAAFVAAMEDVLDVYTRPLDPTRPLVCLDETSKQLIAETRQPEPMRPGQPARHDYEYRRNGTANLFMLFAPLEGWRHVEVTERRTAVDYAKILRDLVDIHFPGASKMVLVQDNLNTHTPASLEKHAKSTGQTLSNVRRSGKHGPCSVVCDKRECSADPHVEFVGRVAVVGDFVARREAKQSLGIAFR